VSVARPVHEVLEIYRYAKKYGQKKAADHFKLTIDQIKRVSKRYNTLAEEIKTRAPSVRSGAVKYGISQGLDHENAEEFGSYCVERYLVKMQSVYYNTAFVDFCRDRLGRNGHKTFERGEYQDPIHEDRKEDIFGFVSKSFHGLLVRLVFKYDFKQKEIAEMVGLTETRIAQILKKELGDAKRRMEADTRI
jgi:hypothetical protein